VFEVQFKETHRTVTTTNDKTEDRWISRFHPTKSILACGSFQVVIFKTVNTSLPFSHWKEKKGKFGPSPDKQITALEWNVSKFIHSIKLKSLQFLKLR
jgi:hypothetical protein